MAVSVGKTIKELNEEVVKLGILDKVVPTGKNGKIKKEDYIKPIRDYNLIQRYGNLNNIPKHLELVLSLKSPMLAGRIDNLKPEQQEEVWNSDEWDMEQKLNGVRCFIINDGSGIQLYSRHNSDVDLLPISFTENVLFPDNCDLSTISKEFILDCELTSDDTNICTILDGYGVNTESQLQAVTSILGSLPEKAIKIQRNNNLFLVFNTFDCLYYDKQWIMNEPLYKRREVAEEIIDALEKCGFNIRRVPHTNKNKKEFFKRFIDMGMEGTVAKRLNGIYIPDTTRNFKGWVKCKRSLSAALQSYKAGELDSAEFFASDNALDDILGGISFGDTIDAFITGFEPGTKGSAFENMVGSVCISVFICKKDGTLEKKEIGKFSGITLDVRRNMTEIIDGQPNLRAEYYNKVVEVDGQNMTKNGRFQHCKFIRFRQDKLPDSCILDEEFLNSQLF